MKLDAWTTAMHQQASSSLPHIKPLASLGKQSNIHLAAKRKYVNSSSTCLKLLGLNLKKCVFSACCFVSVGKTLVKIANCKK